jgi:peptide-methionine (S)-S-oxide reductase
MENDFDITDPLFRRALAAIDAGEADMLTQLLDSHPGLARQRLDMPDKGYFRHPFLLCFIADNPIRKNRLPGNIVVMADIIIRAIRRQAADTLQEQLDYALGLVATGRIPRECGVQAELIDLLIDAGATPGDGIGALANGNPDAAWQLIRQGGRLTLAAAAGIGFERVGIGSAEEVDRMIAGVDKRERQLAVVVAAFYGRADVLARLIGVGQGGMRGVDLDTYPDEASGFHAHGTALHQAVASGSLAAVKVLVEAGADTGRRDKVYEGTPLDWADYLQRDPEVREEEKKKFGRILEYLRERVG